VGLHLNPPARVLRTFPNKLWYMSQSCVGPEYARGVDIIQAGDGGFIATLVPAEFEILVALVSFLGDPGDGGSFHWAGWLSPERERIIELVFPTIAAFRSTWPPGSSEFEMAQPNFHPSLQES